MRTCEKHGIAYSHYRRQMGLDERSCAVCEAVRESEAEIERHEKCAEELRTLLGEAIEVLKKGERIFRHPSDAISECFWLGEARAVLAKAEKRS